MTTFQLTYAELQDHAMSYVQDELPDEYAVRYAEWFADMFYGDAEEYADHSSRMCTGMRLSLAAEYNAQLDKEIGEEALSS